jgi:hypothetical protein
MFNPLKDIDWSPDHAKRREFAISLMIGFPCVALFGLALGYLKNGAWNTSFALMLGGTGASIGLLFFIAPAIVRPFYIGWYVIVGCIGLIVGNILIALVFYGLVSSIGLMRRRLRGTAIRKGVDRDAQSYWIDADPSPPPERYYRQF